MLRDWSKELSNRVKFVKDVIAQSHAKGIIYGNSGGKDCTLTSIICKLACENTIGVIMPCASAQNYGSDITDALATAKQYNIKNLTVDLTVTREELKKQIDKSLPVTTQALANIAPRLRMTALYTVAQSMGYLVAGTGNASEYYMGYFTKWGDGAYDFNCICDLTVAEVYDFLRYLNAPESILCKAPSAGLYEGQTDEKEMGVTYQVIEEYMRGGEVDEQSRTIIERHHSTSEHKRVLPKMYSAKKAEEE